MNITVMGTGCPTCKTLLERVKTAANQMGITSEVEYVTDVEKIVDLGIMHSPALVVDGKPVLVGSLPTIEKIKEVLQQAN